MVVVSSCRNSDNLCTNIICHKGIMSSMNVEIDNRVVKPAHKNGKGNEKINKRNI